MPGPIDSTEQTRRRHDLDLHASTTSTPSRPPTPREIDPHTIVTPAEQHWGPVISASISTSSTAAGTAKTPSQIALDDYRASFSGPYTVGRRQISASPQFRMTGGHNDDNAGLVHGAPDRSKPQVREIYSICARAHAPDPGRALKGLATASEIVRITQALIDAGKLSLPAGASDRATDRTSDEATERKIDQQIAAAIKKMQWQWGIGVDCTDYVFPIATRAAGKSDAAVRFQVGPDKRGNVITLPARGCDYFQAANANPHLKKIGASDVRTGDVMCLDDPGDVGHRAIVYSNAIVDPTDPQRALAGKVLPAAAAKIGPSLAAFARGGPVRMIEVDSSWSAGEDGANWGGVRREILFHNEATGQWAQINPRVPDGALPFFQVTDKGPCGELLNGFYRFR